MGFKRADCQPQRNRSYLRTLRDMGIEAAIPRREDCRSLPNQMADIAYPNYRTNPLDSYLDIGRCASRQGTQCDAVHPGYGFWPRTAFVARLEEEGITFIGPASGVTTLLGDKIEARKRWKPRGHGQGLRAHRQRRGRHALADEIGYPVIIKAAAGGGGP